MATDKFVPFYLNLLVRDKGAKSKETPPLRVFERNNGEFYTAHGEEANNIADEYFKTRDVIKLLGKEELPGVCIRQQKLVKIINDTLKKKGRKLEIWTQDGAGIWRVSKKGSPGNVSDFEEILFTEEKSSGSIASPAIMSLRITNRGSSRQCGLAFADPTLKTLHVCQFVDNDRYMNLESAIIQKGAKECFLCMDKTSTSPAEQEKLSSLFERCKVQLTETKAADFKCPDIEQDLTRLLGSLEQHFAQLELKLALPALSCLIKQLDLLSDEEGFGKFRLQTFDLSQFMRLDKAAVEALNLFPAATDSDKNMSVFGLLNKCKTAMGSRLLSQWIKQPLLDMKQIQRRLNLVEVFTEDTSMRQTLQETHMKNIPDLERLSKRFQQPKKSNLQTVLQMYSWAVRLPGLVDELSVYDGPHKELLQRDFISKLSAIVGDLSQFEAMVEQTIDFDALDNHEYLISPNFNPLLKALSKKKAQVMEEIKECSIDVADDLGLEHKLVKLNDGTGNIQGYHFRISRKNDKALRGKKKYTTLETRKDGIRFINAPMKRLARQYLELKQHYNKEQAEIVAKALEIVATYCPVLERATAVLAELDVLVSFAHIAVNAPTPYCRPTLHPMGHGKIELKQARHPCMEMLASVSAGFIANDVLLEKGTSNVQVITGPNMGGKSTYIRMAGVIALFAQIGCFVPCDSAELTLVDCIQARVGAGDSQLKGVSTFMKEMLEASAIIKAATSNTLIIIDELGRGTSTYDGFGLAWAISEYIASEINAFAMFATHFHELTALAKTAENVVNKHVTAHTDDNSITMLYQVNDGPCDRSFGIHVSELANFPTEVVSNAKRKAAELEDFGNTVKLVEETITPLRNNNNNSSNNNSSKRFKTSADGAYIATGPQSLLNRFLAIPLDDLNDAQAADALSELSAETRATADESNPTDKMELV